MTARELKFIQALGEVDIRYIEKAAPWKNRSADATNGNAGSGWWSGAKYVIGGIAAAAVLGVGAVMLNGWLANAPAPYQTGNSGAMTGAAAEGTRVIVTSEEPPVTLPEPLIDSYIEDIETFTLSTPTDMPEHYADKYVYKFTYLPSSLTDLADSEKFALWAEKKEQERPGLGAYYEPITLYAFLKEFGISDSQLRSTSLYPDWINDEDIDILYSGDEKLIMRTYKSDWTIMHDGMLFTPRWLYEMSVYEYMNRGLPKDEVKELALKMQSLPFTNDAWEHFCEKVEDYIGEPLSDTKRRRTEFRSEEIDGVYARLKVNTYAAGDSVVLSWENIELMNGKQRLGAYYMMSAAAVNDLLEYPADRTVELGLHQAYIEANSNTGNYRYLVIFAVPSFEGGYYATLYWYDGEYMNVIYEPDYRVNSIDDITLEPTNVVRIQAADGEVSYYTVYENLWSVVKLESTEDGSYTLPEPVETFTIGLETTGLGYPEDTFGLPPIYCTGINQAYTEVYAAGINDFSFDALKEELGQYQDSEIHIGALSKFIRGDGSIDTDKLRESCNSTKLYYFLNDKTAFRDCRYVSNDVLVAADDYRVYVFLNTEYALSLRLSSPIRTNIYWLWRLYGDRPDLLESLKASVLYNSDQNAYVGLRLYVDDSTFPIVRPMLEAYGYPRICSYYYIPEQKLLTMY